MQFRTTSPRKIDPLAVNNPRLSATEIISSGKSWVRYNNSNDSTESFNSETDILGPVSIAAISNLSHTSSLEPTFQQSAWLSLGIQHLLPTTISVFETRFIL